MTGYAPLLVKELKEQLRTFKLLALFVVLALLGVGGMVALAFLPELLRLSGDAPGIVFPELTAVDALASYDNSVVQLGLLTVVLMAMGSVARERERKTALVILSKPVSVAAYVLAKLTAYAGSIMLTVAVLGGVAFVYATTIFDGSLSGSGVLAMIGTEALYLVFVAAVTIGASCLFRNQLPAAMVAFGVLALLTITAPLPLIGQHLPGAVTGWGLALMSGQEIEPRWTAVIVTLVIAGTALLFGIRRLRRAEV